VRELINALEYAVVTAEGDTIGLGDLPYGPEAAAQPSLLAGRSAEEGHLARMEQGEILRALQQFGGNGTRAAEFLGINRKTLREKIRKYNLKPQD
jgi:DNA-binding NtrC family response regulator